MERGGHRNNGWRPAGGHGRSGRLLVAALVNCRAANCLINSASPRAAAPGSALSFSLALSCYLLLYSLWLLLS
jgi:hypothetical protein